MHGHRPHFMHWRLSLQSASDDLCPLVDLARNTPRWPVAKSISFYVDRNSLNQSVVMTAMNIRVRFTVPTLGPNGANRRIVATGPCPKVGRSGLVPTDMCCIDTAGQAQGLAPDLLGPNRQA